jgi:hypothetical protein
MMIDCTDGKQCSCIASLPYPAPRCGAYVLECEECHIRVSLTVAGRPDDVRELKVPCKLGQMQ